MIFVDVWFFCYLVGKPLDPFFNIHNAQNTICKVSVFSCLILCISISKSLYFLNYCILLQRCFDHVVQKNLSVSRLFCFRSLITTLGLFALICLSVWMAKSHRMVKFSPSLAGCGWCSYQLLVCGMSLWQQMFQCK